jgi:nucleoside-diphosphate-sugar epimerase
MFFFEKKEFGLGQLINSLLAMISVWGAAGTVGHHCVLELISAGQRVRAVGRSLAKLKDAFSAFDSSLVELCVADVSTPEGCAAAAARCDAIIYTLGCAKSNAHSSVFRH